MTTDKSETCAVKIAAKDNMPCGAAVEYLLAGAKGNAYEGWRHVEKSDHNAVPKSWVR